MKRVHYLTGSFLGLVLTLTAVQVKTQASVWDFFWPQEMPAASDEADVPMSREADIPAAVEAQDDAAPLNPKEQDLLDFIEDGAPIPAELILTPACEHEVFCAHLFQTANELFAELSEKYAQLPALKAELEAAQAALKDAQRRLVSAENAAEVARVHFAGLPIDASEDVERAAMDAMLASIRVVNDINQELDKAEARENLASLTYDFFIANLEAVEDEITKNTEMYNKECRGRRTA